MTKSISTKRNTYWVLGLTLLGATTMLFTAGNAHASSRSQPTVQKALVRCTCMVMLKRTPVRMAKTSARGKVKRIKTAGAYCRIPKHSRNARFIW